MPIEGIWVVPMTLASGVKRYYYYAYRGAETSFWQTDDFRYDLRSGKVPRDFIEAYKEAAQPHSAADETLDKLIEDYKTDMDSPYKRLSPASRKDRDRYLERIKSIKLKDGRLALTAPLSVFENKKIRKYIKAWRNQWSDTPKAADEALVALSALLSFGVDQGDLTFNVVHGISYIYEKDDDATPWTEAQQKAFISDASRVIRLAHQFIRFTGVRRKDAAEMKTTADFGEHLIWRTSKSGRTHEAVIPVLPQLRPVMAELAVLRQSFETPPDTMLFNSRGQPWTPDGLSASFNKHRAKHNIEPTIHDLRKNAATDWIIYQNRRPDLISDDMICDQFDWTRATLKRMKRIYVDRSAVVDAITGRHKA